MMEQPYFTTGSIAMVTLEAMVDRAGPVNVLYALAVILRDKGAAIRASQVETCARCMPR